MKTRMRFTKTGSLKFIGHLDCMRFFQKAFRRAKLDLAYSKGYNPHQIMSFASPLSVGTTSDGEYIDIEFNSFPDMDISEFIHMINEYMTEEIFVTEVYFLDDKTKTSMALLNACDYMISLKDGKTFWKNTISEKEFDFQKTFTDFISQDKIVVVKKTKRSEMEMDIKPHILDYAFSKDEFREKTGADNMPLELYNEYDSEEELFLKLVSGSSINIKPELVLKAYLDYMNDQMKPYSYQVHRIQMYFNTTKTSAKTDDEMKETDGEETL